jgi:Lon protease-like protein
MKVKDEPSTSLDLPHVAPVMVLPNALLFPNSLLPLYIFEPRYREMLRWVLAGERVFCIAQAKPGVSEPQSTEDFHQTGGLGLVRACVGHEDGTSHLVLQGLARVRFTGFVQETPFRIAELRELPSQPSASVDCEALVAQVLAVCARLRASGTPVPDAFDAQLAKIDDPSMLADVVAHAFLKDGARRQGVFDELRVGERLRLLIAHLRAEMGESPQT